MKKFLLPMLPAFAILVTAIQAQAADVPNFKRVAGDIVRGDKKSNEFDNYHVYTYIVDGKYSTGLAEQYVNFLQENGITLIEHKEDYFKDEIDYWERHLIEKWFFSCRGHRVVFGKSWRTVNYEIRQVTFSIQVANELTYEED